MASHTVLSHADWLEARKALLAKEKEFTRAPEPMRGSPRGA